MHRTQHRAFLGLAPVLVLLAVSNRITAQGQGLDQGLFDVPIQEKLNLNDWTLQEIVLPEEAGDEPEVRVELGGAPWRLRLFPHSLRDPKKFRVVLVEESG